jgi:hypothetical protein
VRTSLLAETLGDAETVRQFLRQDTAVFPDSTQRSRIWSPRGIS